MHYNILFFSAYTPIENAEQRVRYKLEFNTYYNKYRELHKVLDQVSKKFANLESKLKEAQKGSQEFKVSESNFKNSQSFVSTTDRRVNILFLY